MQVIERDMTPPPPHPETKYKPKYTVNVQNKTERKHLKYLEVIRFGQTFKGNFFKKKINKYYFTI